MQETQILSLGWEDPLQMGMATLSSTLAWRIPWTEDSGGLQSMGSQRAGHNWATNTSVRAAFCLHLTSVKCLSLLTLQEIAWLFFLCGGLTELPAGYSLLSMCNRPIIRLSIDQFGDYLYVYLCYWTQARGPILLISEPQWRSQSRLTSTEPSCD